MVNIICLDNTQHFIIVQNQTVFFLTDLLLTESCWRLVTGGWHVTKTFILLSGNPINSTNISFQYLV